MCDNKDCPAAMSDARTHGMNCLGAAAMCLVALRAACCASSEKIRQSEKRKHFCSSYEPLHSKGWYSVQAQAATL